MKKGLLRTLILAIVVTAVFSSCIVDTGYRSIDITDISTDPDNFNSFSEDDYTFSVEVDYSNVTLQEAILDIVVHKGDDYHTVATETISMMDSDFIVLTFTDNASNWYYRSEYSFYAYLYSSKPPPLSKVIPDLAVSVESTYYFTP